MFFVHLIVVVLVGCLTQHIECGCPVIISREEWNASEPESVRNLTINPPPYVVVHHSAGSKCETQEECKKVVKSIQDYHMKTLHWEDIGYNFLIGGDGNVYEGRGWGIHGAHVVKYNARSIGICLLGNFQVSVPPELQIEVLKNIIDCAKETEKITQDYHLIGHRQGSATLCPGDYLFDLIKTWPHFSEHPH